MKPSPTRHKAPVLSPDGKGARSEQRDASRAGIPEIRRGHLQTWVSLAALVISMPGLWLAVLAFRDQQATSRSQRTSSAQQVERYQRRYASRVIWNDASWLSNGAIVQIQNRSMTTITDVIILGNGRLSAILPGDIPPCSALTIDLRAALGLLAGSDHARAIEMVIFRDPVGVWTKGRYDLRPISGRSVELLRILARGLHNGGVVIVQLRGEGVVEGMRFLPQTVAAMSPVADCGNE